MTTPEDVSSANVEALRSEVARIRWYHSMDLGHGIRTQGVSDPASKLERYAIPPDLTGKTVLDIGAWDGFFSFECERRGASRVLAVDSFSWAEGNNWGSKAGFDTARRVLGSRVEDKVVEVLDLSPETVGGTFDLVLFLGVLYHMMHPMLAIERVASVCRDQLILETHVDLLATRRPAMALYGWGQLDADTTNFCGPNPAAVELMLYGAGFTRVEIQPPRSRAYNVAKWGATRLMKRGHRMVFHAFK
jgi:tRNA (mo5U34)-methyltransferase